jgi:serine/threonine protein kinase
MIESIRAQYCEIKSILGKGSFGTAFRVIKDESGGKEIVVKVLDMRNTDMFFCCYFVCNLFCFTGRLKRADIWMEYHFQSLIDSEYVVKQFHTHMQQNILYIEMEYANGGTLFDFVKYHLKLRKLISWKDIWIILIRLLKGINGLFVFSLFSFIFVFY